MGTVHARRRPISVVAAVLAAALLLGLLATLPLAIERGLVAGPTLSLRVGDYTLVARTTEHPDCLPLPEQCFIPLPTFRIPQPRFYSVWAGTVTYTVRRGRQSSFATIRGRELIRFEVPPAQ